MGYLKNTIIHLLCNFNGEKKYDGDGLNKKNKGGDISPPFFVSCWTAKQLLVWVKRLAFVWCGNSGGKEKV